MKSLYQIRTHFFQKTIELMMVIMIIGILAVLAINTYKPYITTVKTIHVTGADFLKTKLNTMYYHAHNGTWPKDNIEASTFGWHDNYNSTDDTYIKKTEISDGAISFVFGKTLKGKILTLRPAVPAEDTTGPVKWVCTDNYTKDNYTADNIKDDGWHIQGRDRTNIDKNYIHRSLR